MQNEQGKNKTGKKKQKSGSQAKSPLMEELQQSRPFISKSEETVVALLKTVDFIRSNLACTVSAFGLTPQQYNVLRILNGAGEKGLPTLDIVKRMVERSPGVTRLIDRLENAGLVKRVRSVDDRRQVNCVITPKGISRLEEMKCPLNDLNEKFISHLNDLEISRLLHTLDRIRAEH